MLFDDRADVAGPCSETPLFGGVGALPNSGYFLADSGEYVCHCGCSILCVGGGVLRLVRLPSCINSSYTSPLVLVSRIFRWKFNGFLDFLGHAVAGRCLHVRSEYRYSRFFNSFSYAGLAQSYGGGSVALKREICPLPIFSYMVALRGDEQRAAWWSTFIETGNRRCVASRHYPGLRNRRPDTFVRDRHLVRYPTDAVNQLCEQAWRGTAPVPLQESRFRP